MAEINLRLVSEDEKEVHDVKANFSEEEIGVLQLYSDNTNKLINSDLVRAGLPTLLKLGFKQSGWMIETSPFEWSHIHAFLHIARPFLLSDEPASFNRTKGIINRGFMHSAVKSHLRFVTRIYEGSEYSMYFQVKVGKEQRPMLSEKMLRTWLNGMEYHNDSEKHQVIKEVDEYFGEENTRNIFVLLLSGKAKAILSVNHVVNLILENKKT